MKVKQDCNVVSFLTVGGIGLTGGTSVRDVIKEFDNFRSLNHEFGLVKDPYGLMDLEYALVKQWRSSLNADIAIKNFLWLVKNLNRKRFKFTKDGWNYSKDFLGFMDITNKYISDLTLFEFRLMWHILKFRHSYFKQLFVRILYRLNLTDSLEKIYYLTADENIFIQATRSYMNSLFMELSEHCKYNILLHNAIPTSNPTQALEYFDSIKMIIIDRDPRDTFAEQIMYKSDYLLPGKSLLEKARIFVSDFILKRKNFSSYVNDERILFLMFEELVINYESTLKKIYEFTGVDASNHLLKGRYFNPKLSRKNIGQWKFIDIPETEESFEYISQHLSKYLYEL